MHKHGRHMQSRQMLHPKLGWLSRRMQRIGMQQQARHKIVLVSAQHGRLTPAVGVPAQKCPRVAKSAHCGYGVPQPFTIAFSVSRPRRAK